MLNTKTTNEAHSVKNKS